MTPGARVAAAIDILDAVQSGAPAEQVLTAWARASRFAGSKDRAAVRDHVYGVLRRLRSAAWVGRGLNGRCLMAGALALDGAIHGEFFTGQGHAPAALSAAEWPRSVSELPLAERLDMPDWVAHQMRRDLGAERAEAAMLALRNRAPVFLRVNSRRATRDQAINALAKDGIEARPHPVVETAIDVVAGARRIRASATYLDGLVELQDAHSQAAVRQLPLRDGDRVLDFCAGGGGKSLAMAARAGIELTAHDTAPARMRDIGPRAARAGVKVTIADGTDALPGQGFDLVVVDAPCSGSGTWRRDPTGKWNLSPERLQSLTRTQFNILRQAAGFVTPAGMLAYMTCSVLKDENEAVVMRGLAEMSGATLVRQHTWMPSDDGDGFHLSMIQTPE